MKKFVLCILDGFGLSDKKEGNAVYLAHKETLNRYFEKFSHVSGNASGKFVGLPDGQMGNSEVGHLNIGSGRKVVQDLSRITNAIIDKTFCKNESLLKAVSNAKSNNSSFHIMGLVSDGGVHSHIDHLIAVIDLAHEQGVKNIYIHAITDGRDVPPTSAKEFIEKLIDTINSKYKDAQIASISGRYYAMDRDKNYDRTKLYYDCITGTGGASNENVIDYISNSYKNGVTDEFIKPSLFIEGGKIKEGDSVVFINFRPDRARQITRCFCDDEFSYFQRGSRIKTCFVCMIDYDRTIENKLVAFEDIEISNTLGEVLSKNGIRQLRTAETEKYAHVTFFFNGGKEDPYKGEDRVLIPSPKDVKTYDEKPQMSAYEVCNCVVDAIKDDVHKVIIVNFANPDMVGHTGKLDAAVKAIEAVDDCLSKIDSALIETKSTMLIIADHGNSEKMIDDNGAPWTAHTNNLVPFVLVNYDDELKKTKLKSGGSLCDIAPTILEILHIEKPKEMSGNSLLM